MTDFTIPQLGAAGAISGSNLMEIYQGSDPSLKVLISAIVTHILTVGTAQASNIVLHTTNGTVTLTTSGNLTVSGSGVINVGTNLPTADPNVNGELFVVGPVVPGTPLAIMMSTG